ncbi:MAG: hypothetical protein HQM10_17905 [Candidatus Riflebacteria bacterium]|nr:hypothetical protein [Candidatus Riflebacteria bacterium]
MCFFSRFRSRAVLFLVFMLIFPVLCEAENSKKKPSDITTPPPSLEQVIATETCITCEGKPVEKFFQKIDTTAGTKPCNMCGGSGQSNMRNSLAGGYQVFTVCGSCGGTGTNFMAGNQRGKVIKSTVNCLLCQGKHKNPDWLKTAAVDLQARKPDSIKVPMTISVKRMGKLHYRTEELSIDGKPVKLKSNGGDATLRFYTAEIEATEGVHTLEFTCRVGPKENWATNLDRKFGFGRDVYLYFSLRTIFHRDHLNEVIKWAVDQQQ